MSDPQERLLAVDDRPEVLRLIDRCLGGDYRCSLTGSAAAAREKIASLDYDLAICDIEMPGESGLALAEEIARSHPETAIVMVTGVDDPEVAEHAFRLGVQAYLVKPFWPGQLQITAAKAIAQNRLERAAEAHSQALEDRLQTLMDAAPVPIYIKGTDGRYLLANRKTCELAGVPPNALVGQTVRAFMDEDGADAAERVDRSVLQRGATYEGEERIVVDGRDRTFFTVKFPYLDDAGAIAGVSGISTDVTDRKHAEALRDQLARAQSKAIDDLRRSRLETVERLTVAIEMRDAETGAHIARMATIAAYLADRCGLAPEEADLLRAAAPMHDVGKIAVPDRVLLKPGPLTEDERMEMQQHTLVGHRILGQSPSDLLQLAATIALTHHEWFDGSGYPRGLRGEQIPIEGRIVAVADVFDALVSDRVYRPAMEVDAAMEMISDEEGTHFDPEVAEQLIGNRDAVLELID